MNTRPEWADATVLSVCRPELSCRCDWPDCQQYAVYELEFDVDGEWEAHQICPTHHQAIGVGVGEAR